MKRKILSFLLMVTMLVSLLPVNLQAAGTPSNVIAINATNFPDANFRSYLKNKFDKDGNNYIDNQSKVTFLDVKNSNISSLKGIEYFDHLYELVADGNNLREIDVSKNALLERLSCMENRLTSLDVTKNPNLKSLQFTDNYVTSIDLSKNTKLDELFCRNNRLISLDVSNNKALTWLICEQNYLSELDVRSNTKLEMLYCYKNNLTNLDVRNCPALDELVCSENRLKSLDVSKNANLTVLQCYYNDISTLDLRTNTKLMELFLDYDSMRQVYLAANPELRIGWYTKSGSDNLKLSKFSNMNYGYIADSGWNASTRTLTYKNKLNNSTNYSYEVGMQGGSPISMFIFSGGYSGPTNPADVTEVPNPSNPGQPIIPFEPPVNTIPSVTVSYRTHVQTYGWQNYVSDGQVAGTSGKAKRLEGINIVVKGNSKLSIQYTTHCQSYGWLPWSRDGDMCGTEGEAKRLEAIKIQLAGSDKGKYDVYYRVHAQSYGWLGWAKNGEPSGTAGLKKRLEAIQIIVVKKGQSIDVNKGGIVSATSNPYIAKAGSSPVVCMPNTDATNPQIDGDREPNVSYRTHVQTFGWQGWKYNGQMSGTSGMAKRLEGINIKLTNVPSYGGSIAYTTHCQSYGWLPWSRDGDMCGTEGEKKRLEAIEIKLTGAIAQYYDVYYRVHAQSYGWLGWAKNGAPAGTAGLAKRLEGIQIILVKRGDAAPSTNYGGIVSTRSNPYIAKPGSSVVVCMPNTDATNPQIDGMEAPNVTYRTHVQTFGWQGWKYNGQMSGTSGKAKRLEGINIKLTNVPSYGGNITYRTHVQTYGWQGWKSNGAMSGTSGEAKRLEAIEIKLTGAIAQYYDVYYRVHAQSYGWLNWACNGAPAGTAGYAKRLEGIQIVLVKKGGAAPSTNYGGIRSVSSLPYISR